jgi:O-antigen/teichoic acid export membrane protein
MSIRQHTTSGILWNFAQLLSQRTVTITVSLVLARFLIPEDFGLMAILSVFLAIASAMMESGLREALIRKAAVTEIDLSTAFYTNTALGILAYGLVFLVAPLIAVFYEEPRLINLLRVAGLSIALGGLQVVQVGLLSRELNFKDQMKATLPATSLSGLAAVAFAYTGHGVWALVYQTLIASTLNVVFLFMVRRWRPTADFSFPAMSGMLKFGYKLFLSNVIDLVFRNLYVIVVAKAFAASLVGYFYFAEKIKNIVLNQLVHSIQAVTYPALAKFQGEDTRLKLGYQKIIMVTTFLLFPAMLFLAALAEPLFQLALPERWQPAIVYLQLMCIAGVLYPLHTINLNILKVKGRSDIYLFVSVLKKVVIASVLAASIPFGMKGVLIGQLFSSILNYIPNSYYSARLIYYPMREQLFDIIPALLLASVVALVTYALVELLRLHPLIEFVVLGVGACCIYVTAALLFNIRAFTISKAIFLERFKQHDKRQQTLS